MTLSTGKKTTRKKRSDTGSMKLTERDRLVLCWLIEMDEVSIPQLEILLARHSVEAQKVQKARVSTSFALQQRRRWEDHGYVLYRNPYSDPQKPASLYATRKTIKDFGYSKEQMGYDIEYRVRDLASLPHIFMVNNVRMWLENWMKTQSVTEFTWTSERLLRNQPGETWVNYPDAEITYNGERIAIEVELSHKGMQPYQELLALYNGHSVMRNGKEREFDRAKSYNAVWYLVHPSMETTIKKAVAGHEDRFKVIPLAGKTLEDGSSLI